MFPNIKIATYFGYQHARVGALLGRDSGSSSDGDSSNPVGSNDEASDGGDESHHSGKADEGGATPHASDAEMDFDDGGAAAVAVPPPDAVDPVGTGDADPLPLPDPVELAEPLWAPGIQCAEAAPTGKSSCIVCSTGIARNSVRLDYQPYASVHRFFAS